MVSQIWLDSGSAGPSESRSRRLRINYTVHQTSSGVVYSSNEETQCLSLALFSSCLLSMAAPMLPCCSSFFEDMCVPSNCGSAVSCLPFSHSAGNVGIHAPFFLLLSLLCVLCLYLHVCVCVCVNVFRIWGTAWVLMHTAFCCSYVHCPRALACLLLDALSGSGLLHVHLHTGDLHA